MRAGFSSIRSKAVQWCAALLCLLFHYSALGQRSLLDRSFGDGGRLVLKVKKIGGILHDVFVLADDKFLVSGNSDVPIVVKFKATGVIDSSFGLNGIAYSIRGGTCITTQPDNKIVTAGTYYSFSAGIPYFSIARLMPDGSLDSTFNNVGHVTTQLYSSTDDCHAMALQSDGKILLAGDGQYYPLFIRYLPDGQIDSSFGSNGKVVDARQYIGHNSSVYAVLLQPDGKFVAVGNIYNVEHISHKNDFLLLRYNSDGTPDSSFGTNGVVTTDFGAYDYAYAAALQPDGKIIAAGRATDQGTTGDDFAIARYNPDGSLDTTFGFGGMNTTDVSGNAEWDLAYSMALQPDGKIVLAGRSYGHTRTFALARYLPSGVLDSAWGNNGRVNTNIGGYDDEANGVALQSDGKIIAVGYSVDSTTQGITNTQHFALARYYGDASVSVSFITREKSPLLYPNPVSDVLFIAGAEGASLSIYDMQGRIVSTAHQYQLGKGIDVRALVPGIYMVRMQHGHDKYSQSFRKQ